mgnify:CR=1 FL=1
MSASGENGRNGAYYPREVRDVSTEREERKPGRPDGEDDVINKYGTYEVQRNNGEKQAEAWRAKKPKEMKKP